MVENARVMCYNAKGDRSLYPCENNAQVKTRNLTSGNKDAKIYALVTKADESYLDAVCIKYRQKVIR